MELTQLELIREAQKLGVKVDLLEDCGSQNILLSRHGKEVLFSPEGIPLDRLNYQAFYTAGNKQFCKRIFKKVGISYPLSLVFNNLDTSIETILSFMKPNELYVCKPLKGTEGLGVCMNIGNIKELRLAWEDWKNDFDTFMLEEQKEGGDLRIQSIGGKIVAACIREPASVIGDGKTVLSTLISERQAVIQQQNPSNKLELDKASFELLAKQNLTLGSIPEQGQKVQLKYVANMNQGAQSIDITAEIHPQYKEWIKGLSKALNLSIFALDILTTDYTQMPTAKNAWAIEINGQPYWFHHTFSERRTHNIAKMILEEVFGSS